MRYSATLFDLDGTLLDTLAEDMGISRQSANKFIQELGAKGFIRITRRTCSQ